MTWHYTDRDERYLAEKRARAGALSTELFMCSDGNYRDADAKARYEEMRRKLLADYSA